MSQNDDRPDAVGEGADDQGQEDWNPLGLDVTSSTAAVNLSWLTPDYRKAVSRLRRHFPEDFRIFEETALALIACNGATSGDDVNAELRRTSGLRRDHYWRAILARVFRHRHPSKAAAMQVRRGRLDLRDARFWSDLFER